MKQMKSFLLLSLILIVNGSCISENKRISKYVCFEDLDKQIQDTLKKLPIDTFGCYPNLIDFTGQFELQSKEFGPWIYAQVLKNISNGKSYRFDYNTPRPFIVTSREIIFPVDYNIITMGLERQDTFAIVNIN